eukprot:gene19227-25849_t
MSILLPMLEESPLAPGLADGASHATAEELLQILEWMSNLGEVSRHGRGVVADSGMDVQSGAPHATAKQ